jgi:hypothetical protein
VITVWPKSELEAVIELSRESIRNIRIIPMAKRRINWKVVYLRVERTITRSKTWKAKSAWIHCSLQSICKQEYLAVLDNAELFYKLRRVIGTYSVNEGRNVAHGSAALVHEGLSSRIDLSVDLLPKLIHCSNEISSELCCS